ncbi:hypothetical protein GGS23DRAFT_600903 [Durotheca rogersii]|uniref:uncharacterized protein n=1 Tax=Durotheca rogersii TaxID=419775 RepID=UPI00221ECF9F|nr:uncharacterized protein GGS23DRAFT_600903 [Durotheca rogersii]KAI5857417.1 hypothetical protein GGS23DRAFT_600903 [Durotheca rogersii]
MPKHTRSSSSSHNRYSNQNQMPVSLAPSAPVPIYTTRPSLPLNTGAAYYPTIGSSAQPQPPMQAQTYDPYPADVVPQAPLPNRPSSGAWTVHDDQNLVMARQQGLNWAQIQSSYFPTKSPNACRKRHERLMERKGADDWDNRKLERLAKEYMSMRKEIWQPLAARTGEKWIVVEAKCMNNGLKNLQSAARSASRRERLETGGPIHGYDDDSGISGIGLTPVDDLDASYSSPETTASSSGGSNGGGYHSGMHHMALNSHPYGANYTASTGGLSSSYGSSVSSTAAVAAHYGTAMAGSHSQGGSPYLGDGQRLPNDMGIDAIINRPGRSGGHTSTMRREDMI